MPKSTVGNWVMVPSRTGGQKSTQDRYRRRSTAVADGGLARAPSLRPPAKLGKAGLSKAQRKTFEAAPPGRVLGSEERESARARLRAALVRHRLHESLSLTLAPTLTLAPAPALAPALALAPTLTLSLTRHAHSNPLRQPEQGRDAVLPG